MTEKKDDERSFLHDIASPIGTAIFLAEGLLDTLQKRAGTDPDDLIQVAQIYEAVTQVKKMLVERREVLIKRGAPSAGS